MPSKKKDQPAKPAKPTGWGVLTHAETKLLLASLLCIKDSKTDPDKLSFLTETTKKTNFNRLAHARKKLEQMFQAQINAYEQHVQAPGAAGPSSQSTAKAGNKRRRDGTVTEEAHDDVIDNAIDEVNAIGTDLAAAAVADIPAFHQVIPDIEEPVLPAIPAIEKEENGGPLIEIKIEASEVEQDLVEIKVQSSDE